MTEQAPASVGRRLWQTVAAILLTHVTWVIAFTLFGGVSFALTHLVLYDGRDLLYTLFGVSGVIVGIIAARALCDRLLRDYMPRVVSVVIIAECLISLLGLVKMMRTDAVPDGSSPIASAARYLATAFAAYLVFYRGGGRLGQRAVA